MISDKVYIAIDLKSFYASVECIERKLNPMTTNLVVADMSRTEKTIRLAVFPSLKSFGIPGRPRLFEVVHKVKEVNNECRRKAGKLVGESYNINELNENPSLAVGYIVAPPRMAHYMDYSTRIYQVYLKHVAPEDIHVYSIDEVFIDATGYLKTHGMNGHEFARMLIRDVLATTGITATAGIGTNLYLAKVAMDIKAKKMPADEDGVRIAELDEISYRKELWDHRPRLYEIAKPPKRKGRTEQRSASLLSCRMTKRESLYLFLTSLRQMKHRRQSTLTRLTTCSP